MSRSFLAALVLCPLALAFAAFSATNPTEINPNAVIADIDGTKVTLGEFEQKRADNLFQAQNTYYQAERDVLMDYVNELLLKKQAQKEGVTIEELIDRHVKSTLPKDPSEEALRVYYEGVDTKQPFEAVRDKILNAIRQSRMLKARNAYIESLRAQANVVISLPAPRAEVSLENTPVLGAQNAPVVVVEYADYECPYCQQVAPTLHKLETEYQGKVAFAFKDTPLPMHAHAQKAAEAAHCAGAQGKYWDYHDLLFDSKKLEVPELKQDARKLNLDGTAFDKCLDSGQQAPAVGAQYAESQRLGIQGTPAFFINGRFLSGAASYEQLHAAIEQELTLADRQPKQTASAAR